MEKIFPIVPFPFCGVFGVEVESVEIDDELVGAGGLCNPLPHAPGTPGHPFVVVIT
jgi:hypothetical protein